MKYYIIEAAAEYVYPSFNGWYGILDAKTLEKRKVHEMPKHLLFYVEEHMQMVFTDILLFPCFMVTDRVRQTIMLYDPLIRYHRIILLDKIRKKSMAYYIPFLTRIEDTNNKIIKIGTNKNNIFKLDKEKLGEKVLVKIHYNDQMFVVIRQDLVESILRRKTVGIGLRETEEVVEEKLMEGGKCNEAGM